MAKTILLTGATGFIAAHVLDELLRRGYRVRATVRSQDKFDALMAMPERSQYKDRVEPAIVEDISKLGSFDHCMEGIDAVIHTASPFHFNTEGDNERTLLIPAINGTKSVLQAAAKTPSVKRIVITSSFASIFGKTTDADYTYTVDDWAPLDYETGKNATEGPVAYRASKVLAEKTAWEFKKSENPQFDITTMCPPMVFGPVVHPLKSLDDLNTSNAQIWSIASGKADSVPPTRTPLWVDVRDLAKAHVEALERDVAGGKRYALTSGGYSNQLAADIIHEKFAWAKDSVPVGNTGEKKPHFNLDAAPAERDLGIHFRAFEETVVDMITQFKKLQDGGK